MSRTTITAVAGLMVLACVVALLPAQESSRRTAARQRLNAPGPAGSEQPGPGPLSPAVGDFAPALTPAPAASASGSPSPRSQPSTIGQQLTRGYGEQSSAASSDAGAVAGTEAANEIDDSSLRSVLKRSKGPANFEPPTQQPPTAAPPAAAGGVTNPPNSGDLPRRAAPGASAKSAAGLPARSALGGGAGPLGQAVSIGKSAALKVEVAGPQGVTVGKPAQYVVTLSNESESAADDVQLRVVLPTFVAVQAAQPTSGEAGMQADPQGGGRLVWSLPRVAGRAREILKLELLTREGDAFELGVEWTCRPAAARAVVIIKQPQLDLSLAGPAEMTFGEEKTFTLSVNNPGTGDAEHVIVTVAAGDSPPQQFDAGTIPAGHKKEVPLAVVASQAGMIDLAISATCDGGLQAQTAAKINVRKAEVSLAIAGPPLKFAGTEATYLVTVANSGTAAADSINMMLALPPGATYLGGIEGAAAAGSSVKWKIATLPAGGERVYEVRLTLAAAGTNRLVVQAQATASGTASSTAETQVEAVADLKLVVNDPSGPLPTDEHAVYELQVMNRGSQAARQVKIVVQFSDGVEPVAFEGCEARIVPGQVLCQPLAQLGPGEQATLRVKARAVQAGTHQFRVEVTSTDGDARLVSEGTTRFFSESGRSGAAATTAQKPSLLPTPSVPTTLR